PRERLIFLHEKRRPLSKATRSFLMLTSHGRFPIQFHLSAGQPRALLCAVPLACPPPPHTHTHTHRDTYTQTHTHTHTHTHHTHRHTLYPILGETVSSPAVAFRIPLSYVCVRYTNTCYSYAHTHTDML